MIRKDSSEINPFILSDEAHHQVHKSHYVLGETRYRDLQDKRKAANQKVLELAAKLGVDFKIPEPDVEGILEHIELMKIYNENRQQYDEALSKVFAKCPPEMVIAYLDNIPRP